VDNLRFIVGLVLAKDDAVPKAEHVSLMKENGYKEVTFPAVETAVCTEFPFRNTISCILSVFRVYPALREYTGMYCILYLMKQSTYLIIDKLDSEP